MCRVERWQRKSTTEEYKHIDIKDFKNRWVLKEWELSLWSFSFRRGEQITGSMSYWIDMREPLRRYMKLKFTKTDRDWVSKNFDYDIRITSTDCYFWWKRYWFVCPQCWKKYWRLYLASNWYFYCRKCLNLGYSSQLEWGFARMWKMLWPTRAEEDEAYEIYKTIKYKYRNWKETRKYKKYKKLMWENISWQRRRAWVQIFNNWMSKNGYSM